MSLIRRHQAITVIAAVACVGAIAAPLVSAATTHRGRAPAPMQLGLDTFVAYRCQGVRAFEYDATTQVDEDRALHANAIGLAFPLYMPTLTSDQVASRLDCADPRFETPPVSLLSKIISIAHRAGLHVLLRPLIVLTHPGRRGDQRGWRGIIAPKDLDVWFQQYRSTLGPYLVMAQADHVEHVAIASELDSLADARQWPSVVTSARHEYKGDLVFDLSWNAPERKEWKPGTSPALDAYPNLPNGSANQTAPQLVAQWNELLASNPDYNVPALTSTSIDEVGILAQVGAYADPAASVLPMTTHPFNQSVQVRWFRAACVFSRQHHLGGLYFWGAWLTRNDGTLPRTPEPARPSDIQPAAQAAIRACFS